ncbi:MAG: PASTA domain-containing protein, partial [Thermoanaerobaculia bacterium]
VPEFGEDALPDLTGRSARDAVRLLAARGIAARLQGTGFVVSQEPPPGSRGGRGTTCALVLSPTRGVSGGTARGGLP